MRVLFVEDSEVNRRVIKEMLRAGDIEVTAIHSHMLDEQPRLFFLHFWAVDDAMKLAKGTAPPEAAEIVACECVVHAETKDHANWELLSAYGQSAKGDEKEAIDAASPPSISHDDASTIHHEEPVARGEHGS